MEEINRSFNIKSLYAFAENTANFAQEGFQTREEADLEYGKNEKKESKKPLIPPVVKTILLVIVAVLLIVLLVYFIYKKLNRNKPSGHTESAEPKESCGDYRPKAASPSTSEMLNKLQQLQSIKEADNESEELLQDDSEYESEEESEESDHELLPKELSALAEDHYEYVRKRDDEESEEEKEANSSVDSIVVD